MLTSARLPPHILRLLEQENDANARADAAHVRGDDSAAQAHRVAARMHRRIAENEARLRGITLPD